MKDNKISAVYKEDLRNLLVSIGECEPVSNNQRNCSICSRVISLDNIQLLVPRAGNKYDFVCNNSECVSIFNSNSKK